VIVYYGCTCTLVYLEWDDAGTHAGWLTPAEAHEYGDTPHMIQQVGFIVRETRRYLLIAGSRLPENAWHVEKVGDVTRIPKTWIRVRRVLGWADEKGVMRWRK
jgi:hypothetical protein